MLKKGNAKEITPESTLANTENGEDDNETAEEIEAALNHVKSNYRV